MVRLRHCHMISKYGTPLSKAVGPVAASVLAVEKSYFPEYPIDEKNMLR